MATGQSELTLRFLAAPTDVAFLGGSVHGGRVLEWIDKAAYALAVGWSGHYCVTAYVGNIHIARPIEAGHLVEVHARMMHTGRSSMDIQVTVSSADPQIGTFTPATKCLVIVRGHMHAAFSGGVRFYRPIRSGTSSRWKPVCCAPGGPACTSPCTSGRVIRRRRR